jgi:hypothetical protein
MESRMYDPSLKGSSVWKWVVGLVVVIGIAIGWQVLKQWGEEKQAKEGERIRGEYWSQTIVAQLKSGILSHELQLTNVLRDKPSYFVKPRDYYRCDLTLTIFFDTGERLPVTRYWEQWSYGETKEVTIPNKGSVQRFQLTGTIYDAPNGARAVLDAAYSFGKK